MASDDSRERSRAPRPPRPAAGGGGGRPTSVRESVAELRPAPARKRRDASDAGAPPSSPEAEAAALAVDGVQWTVRVCGRGRAGVHGGPAPLLVLGFFRGEEGDIPEREALVVARSLKGLTARQLEGAFRLSQPPPPPGSHKELFPETATKGRKGER